MSDPVLTPDELDKLEASLTAEFDELDNKTHTPEVVKLMESVADSLDLIRTNRAAASNGTPPTAASSKAGRRATLGDANRVVAARGGHEPSPASRTRPRTLTSSVGGPIESSDELHKRFAKALNNTRGLPRDGFVSVASLNYDYPEDRHLRSGQDATSKLDAVVSEQSLVASGGICAPVNVSYDAFNIGTGDRPLRNGLPQFQADRGGVSFILPPNLATTAAGIGMWTAATDANPGGATKPRVNLTCGQTQTVLVDAVTERALVGNLLHQFQPEQMAALLNTLDINFARTAELNLLTKISANSTSVSASQLLGATRDLLPTIDLAVSAYRYRNRVPRTLQLTVLMPDWAKDLIRADLAREQANSDPLAVTDAEIASYFTTEHQRHLAARRTAGQRHGRALRLPGLRHPDAQRGSAGLAAQRHVLGLRTRHPRLPRRRQPQRRRRPRLGAELDQRPGDLRGDVRVRRLPRAGQPPDHRDRPAERRERRAGLDLVLLIFGCRVISSRELRPCRTGA